MKVYWSRCGHGEGNFGDQLTPWLLEHFKVRCEWAPPEHAELIGVGSVLEKVPERFKGWIWSSGFMHACSQKPLPQARVLAVRGPLTLARLPGIQRERVCLGDGGLLACLRHQPTRPKYQLGLIPHFVDVADPIVAEIDSRSPEIKRIDVCRPPAEVVRAIGECRHILSSSLHGLVVADSLRIPSRWMELNRGEERVWGEGFKFHDYYSNFGLEAIQPVTLAPTDDLQTLLPLFEGYGRPGLESLQGQLGLSLERIAADQPPFDPEQAAEEQAARDSWMARLPGALERLSQCIGPADRFLLCDDDQLRAVMGQANAVPFLEKDGAYWGPPPDDATAIAELERLRRCGVDFLVIAWPSFWWLDHYTAFRRHLRTTFPCLLEDADLVVFDLRRTLAAPAPGALP